MARTWLNVCLKTSMGGWVVGFVRCMCLRLIGNIVWTMGGSVPSRPTFVFASVRRVFGGLGVCVCVFGLYKRNEII